jgi:hypothetical protein
VRPASEKEELDRCLEREGAPPAEALARAAWLRRFLPAEQAARAAELLALRERAATKFQCAERLWLTASGLEQSTHPHVAAWRARRVAAAAAEQGLSAWDGTCGLGGELAELARSGAAVGGGDIDFETVRCARHNLGVWGLGDTPVVQADVLAPPLADPRRWLLIVDPSRRPGGRRTLDADQWAPPFRRLAAVLGRFAGSCVKLAPSARPEELEGALPAGLPHAWTWVSRAGELAELCLWTGVLAPRAQREVVLLARDGRELARHSGAAERAEDAQPVLDPLAVRFIAAPDPALVTSGLLGPIARAAGLAPLGSGIGFVGGDAPGGLAGLRDLAVRAACKLDRKAVRRMLGEHGVGPVRVLARGLAESADELERRLAGPGTERGLLVAARTDSGRCVWLVDEGDSRAANGPNSDGSAKDGTPDE